MSLDRKKRDSFLEIRVIWNCNSSNETRLNKWDLFEKKEKWASIEILRLVCKEDWNKISKIKRTITGQVADGSACLSINETHYCNDTLYRIAYQFYPCSDYLSTWSEHGWKFVVQHGWGKVVYTTESIRAEPIFFSTRTFFIRAVPKFFGSVNGGSCLFLLVVTNAIKKNLHMHFS